MTRHVAAGRQQIVEQQRRKDMHDGECTFFRKDHIADIVSGFGVSVKCGIADMRGMGCGNAGKILIVTRP